MSTFSQPEYAAEFHVKPNDSEAYFAIWNSAAIISNPESRIYRGRVDVTSDVMTGSDASSQNVQTSKVVTYPPSWAGSTAVVEFRCSIEGRTKNIWLFITVDELPR